MELIVALDFSDEKKLLSCVEILDPSRCALKVGLEAFTRFGPAIVTRLVQQNFRVFLDLKYHDIPNTVSSACLAAAELGVFMVNVHAAGGIQMMAKAANALATAQSGRPYLIAVTVLTSEKASIEAVLSRAKLAHEAGLDGVVCSALEVPSIKAECGTEFITVTPGIRLPEDDAHDQVRIVTPIKAQQLGSDYAVIGRPITGAKSPRDKLLEIYDALNQDRQSAQRV